MNKCIGRIIISIFLITSFSVSISNAEDTVSISLEEALKIAYTNNPRMIEAKKFIEASKGDLITARTLLNPEMEVELGGLKKNEKGERKTNLDSIAFKQNFDPLGVRELKSKIAKNDVLIQEESLRSTWSEVYSEVREAHTKIILDKKSLELTNDNLNVFRQFFSHVQQRFQSGQALKNDVQRSRIELLKAENDYLLAEKEFKIDKAKLNLLLGRPMEIPLDIKEELKEEILKLNLQELTDTAFSKTPNVKIAQFELDSKRKNLTKEQLNRLPSFALGFQKTNEDFEKDYSAIIEVSVPFWNLNQGEVKKAKAEKEVQEAKAEAVKREVSFDVYQAFLDAEVNQKQIDLLKKSLEEANELLRLANLRYSEGEIDFINYLDQVKTATETRIRYYEGLFNLNKSINELEKIVYSSLRQEDYFK